MSRAAVIAVFAIACGGSKPAPQSPTVDTRALAAELITQLRDLATIIHDRRDDCPRMANELRVVFARMKISLDRARELEKDPELARKLTTEMRAYDRVSTQSAGGIDADFTVDATCARDPAVRDALQAMPTL